MNCYYPMYALLKYKVYCFISVLYKELIIPRVPSYISSRTIALILYHYPEY